MADFAVPFVNQVAKAKDDQEQARASQQMMQVAQLALYQQRQQDQEMDREFRQNALVLQHSEFGEEMQLKAANNIGKLLKLPGTITIDGLKPYAKVFTDMQAAYAKGGEAALEPFGTALSMMQDKQGWLTLAQQGELPKYKDAYQGLQAKNAVEWSNPGNPTEVQESRTWIESHKSELAELLGENGDNKKRLEETVKGGAPNAAATAQEQLARVTQLEDEQKFHQAVVNEDVARTSLNQRVASWAKTHPDAIKILEKHGLQGMGILPTDDAFIKSEYNRLLQKPTLSSDEQRKLDGYMKYILGKSGESIRAAGEVQRITEKQTQYRSEGQMIDEVRKGDQQGQDSAEQFRTTMGAFMESLDPTTQTEEQWKTRQLEARGMSMMLGEQQQARVQANQPKIDRLMQEQDRLQEEIAALRKRLPTTPAGAREGLREELHAKEDILQAREAEANLLSEYDPLKGVELEWTRRIQRLAADHAKAALASESLTDDERTKLQTDYDAAESAAQDAETRLKKWTGERNTHLDTLSTVQTGMERASRVLDLKKTATQHAIEKEDKTTGLFQAVVTDMAADRDLSFTEAVTRNLKDYKGADLKTLKAEVEGFFKHDYDQAVAYGQHVLTGLITKHAQATGRTELNPVELADLAHQAGDITKKFTKMLVKEDDLLKVNEKGKSTIDVNMKMPQHEVSNAIQVGQAYQSGKWVIGKMTEHISKDPTAVGLIGDLKQIGGAISQQWAAARGAEFSKGGEYAKAFKAIKFWNTESRDYLETLHKILVYSAARVLNPTGVLSDADAEAGEEVVGSLKSWHSGPQQLINKLTLVDEWMEQRAKQAGAIIESGTPKKLFQDNPELSGKSEAAKPGAAPPAAPAAQPQTAEEYLKMFLERP